MKKYTFSKIEEKWRKRWLEGKTYEPNLDHPQKPFYNLMMFPYPSAEGLHIGSVRTFTGVDIYGRYKRMQGHDVFQPIGLDGFGIHSENYAIKIGKHPMKLATVTEKNFYRQLGGIGNGFSWDERLETYDPEYYRWTQWIFIQLFKAGLAYRKKASVHWCPKCSTVLADEQVVSGKCERCGTEVVEKELEQWFFRITEYAERLLQGLEHIDWSENIKTAQKNWIGKSEGALITFTLKVPGESDHHSVSVFTTRPDTLFGATFLAASPELAKSWLDIGWSPEDDVKSYIMNALKRQRDIEGKEKTGIFSGVRAINPANGEEIPVWVTDYVLGEYGTGAIMAVPAHDARDFEFAEKYNLRSINVISPATSPVVKINQDIHSTVEDFDKDKILQGKAVHSGTGTLRNSPGFDGLLSEEAKWKITEKVGGKRETHYRLRDWLISRQRYWGPPIPMVWCDACGGWIPEREENLPVVLPNVKEFRPTGTDKSPLANFPEFYETACPSCGKPARRETDVSDTFLDSAWYYIRYLDPKNSSAVAHKDRMRAWLPVHMYIGGAEHAVLHLLYVRFLSFALHDAGVVDFAKEKGGEPITSFRSHGLITKDGSKMSKSKGNVVNPDDYLSIYGVDAVRMYLAFLAPLDEGGDFRDTGIRGMTRFLNRIWSVIGSIEERASSSESVQRATEKTIQKVSRDIENLQYNTAISALMVLLNTFEERKSEVGRPSVVTFVKLLAPFAPHMAEELYEMMGEKSSVHRSEWPTYDPNVVRDKTFTFAIQINGKTRDIMEVPAATDKEGTIKAALERPKIKKQLGNTPHKKIIFIERRLINFVV